MIRRRPGRMLKPGAAEQRDMTLLKTLLQPDHDENEERAEAADAANLLQVGEFQLLQLAFHAWHERDMPQAMIDPIFTRYMLYNGNGYGRSGIGLAVLEQD